MDRRRGSPAQYEQSGAVTEPSDFICCDPACGHQAIVHKDRKCSWRNCQCEGLLVGLSKREMEVLLAMARGSTDKEIAETLNLSLSTVFAHKYNMFHKTGAQSTRELILGALRSGIIKLEDLPVLKARVQVARPSAALRRHVSSV